MQKTNPIGVFDSGLGGLSVLKKLAATLPNEDYVYFGDTARVPYGEKTQEELLQFVREILDWYKSNKAKAVLMACNTSSAITLNIVKDEYDFPIFGLIQPAASYIAGLDSKNIGIIATTATARSKAYSKEILKISPDKQIFEIGCPGLVEIVESGKVNSAESINKLEQYIMPILENKADKIVLGCTHYPFLAESINQITNRPDMLIDPADCLIKAVYDELSRLELLNNSGSRKYFVSSNPNKFTEVGSKFYPDCTKAHLLNPAALRV